MISAVESKVISEPRTRDTIDKVVNNCQRFLNCRLLTLRDTKRFYNQFIYDYSYIQNDVQMYDFLLLSLIKYTDKAEFEKLHRLEYIDQGAFFARSTDRLWFLKDGIASPKPVIGGSDNNEVKELPKCIDILRALFPSKNETSSWKDHRYNKIFSVSSFETYFYNFEYNHLYAKDFRLLYNGTLKEACVLIDGWGDRLEELEEYFQTRDVLYFGYKERLSLFFGILLYTYNKYPSIDLENFVYTFLRYRQVNDIKERYDLNDEEYNQWITKSLVQLSYINADISNKYLNSFIKRLCADSSDEDYYLSISFLQKISLSVFEDYMKRIDGEGWNASSAFYLSQIPVKKAGHLLTRATKLLRKSMMARPEKYIDALIPICVLEGNTRKVGFNTSFYSLYFKEVFLTDEEFESVIKNSILDGAEYIELVRNFWQLFKNNNYSPVPCREDLEDKPDVYLFVG